MTQILTRYQNSKIVYFSTSTQALRLPAVGIQTSPSCFANDTEVVLIEDEGPNKSYTGDFEYCLALPGLAVCSADQLVQVLFSNI